MARTSGNVSANGSIQSNTSNQNNDFTISRPKAGTYRINFTTPYTEAPSVLVTVINWDAEMDMNQINTGVIVNPNYAEVEFWRDGNYSDQSFSFAAFGSQS